MPGPRCLFSLLDIFHKQRQSTYLFIELKILLYLNNYNPLIYNGLCDLFIDILDPYCR